MAIPRQKRILAKALQTAGKTDGAAVARAMGNTEFNLLTGKLRRSTAGQGHEPERSDRGATAKRRRVFHRVGATPKPPDDLGNEL